MLRDWGAHIWRGLYIEGLIFRILRYYHITKTITISKTYTPFVGLDYMYILSLK